MAEYIERTEELMLALNAGARAIENTKRYHGAVYTKDVFSESPQEIPYLQAAKVLREVSDAPAADVAPVVHGRWIHSRYEDCSEQFELVKCSQCNHEAYAMAFYVRGGNYCPNCGAKMDGEKKDGGNNDALN